MKASILKPILWNSNHYVRPSGDGASSGYPFLHGFGHEEWNNNPGWIWGPYRVFHTETKDRVLQYSKNGELGILMIASHGGQQYAVGVAAGVFDNSERDMKLIAAKLGLYENWRQLWDLDLVREKYKDNKKQFLSFWRKNCHWMQWKVDPNMYHWFREPVLLSPKELTGKRRLMNRFGSYQPARPELVARTIRMHVPKAKHGLVKWFEEGPFDERFMEGKPAQLPSETSDPTGSGGSNAPTSREIRYWVYGERTAEPLHHDLQISYVAFLRRRHGIECVENKRYVDVQYRKNGKSVLVEVKPTDKIPPKYAIRAAIGQLLEYQHSRDQTAELEIVISTMPRGDAQVKLLKALGIRLWCKRGRSFKQLA